MKLKLVATTILLLLLTAGCSTDSSFGNVRSELPKQLGYMIYEEAVEYYGKPDSIVRMGDRFTAEWVRSGTIVTERLKLTFDERQIMRAYDYSETPFE